MITGKKGTKQALFNQTTSQSAKQRRVESRRNSSPLAAGDRRMGELKKQNTQLRHACLHLEKSCAHFARQQEVLRAREQELAAIYQNTPLTILLVDANGRIAKANKFAETFARDGASQLFGLRPGEALHCACAMKSPGGCGSGRRWRNCTLLSVVRDTLKTGRNHHRVETTFLLSHEGQTRPVTMLLSSARIKARGQPHALIALEDITAHKQSAERVAQLIRLHAMLAGVDHAIVHHTDQKKLLSEICRVAVKKGGFKLAWVGFIRPDGSLQPVARAGKTGYLKNLRVVVHDVPEGRGPAGVVIRENRPVIINDLVRDPRMNPWRKRAKRFGLRYVAAFPVRVAGKTIGATGLYASRPGFFNKEDVSLLSLISDEISFALTAIDTAAKRKCAVEASLQSEKELADFFDRSPLGLLWVDPDGRIRRINQAELKLLDCAKEVALGRMVRELHDDPEVITQLLERLTAGETVKDYRARIRQKTGKIKHVLIDANGLWVNGRLKHTRWFVWDITRLVELEREILTVGERVQRQLGLDLHDDLGQQLTSIEFLSEALATELATQSHPAMLRAREIAALSQRALTKTRKLSHYLFPIGMEQDGLINALRGLAKSIRKIFKINASFQGTSAGRWLNPATSIHLYRIAQEAVNNAIKHGKARRIEISLSASATNVVMAVKNNGSRLPENVFSGKGIGLRLMQYRAGIIGGSLRVQYEPGGKTAVVCTVRKHLQIHAGEKQK